MCFVLGKQLITVLIDGWLKDCRTNFFELRGEIDIEWVFVDGSYIRAHQHASRARHNEERAIGKSCGGATTKIHIAADTHGNPLDFEITGGEIHNAKVADILIKNIGVEDNFIADKGYDS